MGQVKEQQISQEHAFSHPILPDIVRGVEKENGETEITNAAHMMETKGLLETTTVWVFPNDRLETEVGQNLLRRFVGTGGAFVEVPFNSGQYRSALASVQNVRLLYVSPPEQWTEETLTDYRRAIGEILEQIEDILSSGSFLVLEAKDFHTESGLVPAGWLLWEDMTHQGNFLLKEIVVVAPEKSPHDGHKERLDIIHRYLLVYLKGEKKD